MIFSARCKFLLTLSLLCFGELAAADEYHYNNLLIGDRASGMGGAYTAVSDDATGMYYNPAGIVYVGDKNFSASVNAYYSQYKKYDNVIGNKAFERNSSALLANYFGIVKAVGSYKIGFSYAVPDSVGENQNQTFDNVSSSVSRFTINLNNRDNTYNFGPSIATEISDTLAAGLTLYVHQRDAQLIVNQYSERIDTSTQWTSHYFHINETGLRPILGISWSPAEKVSLGLSASKTLVLHSSASSQNTCWDSTAGGCAGAPAGPSIVRPTITDYSIKRQYPTKIALGAAYFADKDLLFSGDFTYYTAVKEDPLFGEKVATYNVAVGAEYYLSKKWAVRAGLFTNNANTPNMQAGVTRIEEQINLYGISASLTNFTGTSSVTFGGNVNYGKGKSQISTDASIQNASIFGWQFFLSSSY